MKNKKQIAVISAIVGTCVLSTAAFASYQTANGYDSLKESIKNTRNLTNCTFKGNAVVSVDDKQLGSYDMTYMFDGVKHMTHSMTSSSFTGEDNYSTDDYKYDGKYYLRCTNEDGSPYYISFENYDYASTDKPTTLWFDVYGIDDSDSATADKVIRFMELASDTVVGDLKNNFVCSDDNDEYTSYSVNLDSVQIPEIVNAGLSLMLSTYPTYPEVELTDDGTEVITTNDMAYYIALLGNDPALSNVALDFKVGKNNIIRDGNMTVTFEGDGHTMQIAANLSLSDIDSTSIAKLDPTKVKITAPAEVETYDTSIENAED